MVNFPFGIAEIVEFEMDLELASTACEVNVLTPFYSILARGPIVIFRFLR